MPLTISAVLDSEPTVNTFILHAEFFSLMKRMTSTSGALNTYGLKSAISQFSERFATRK